MIKKSIRSFIENNTTFSQIVLILFVITSLCFNIGTVMANEGNFEPNFDQDNKATVRIIKGIVKDESGEALIGVSVSIKGTTWGVVTDINGEYNLAIPIKGATLVYSYIGMKTQEIETKDKKVINIILLEDKRMLDEVVCTGIQTISRERSTGSFNLLKSEDINKTLTSDLISRIDGKIPGLQIDNQNKITIRGRGSIMSDTEPLVVVDGFPIETGISSVNPDDIANMTVLKDAAAASIWGVRAANGVIVITTKNGQQNTKPTFNFSYSLTVNEKNKVSDLHLLSASESVDHQLEYIRKGWWEPNASVNTYHIAVNKLQEAYYNAMVDPNRPNTYDGIRNEKQFKDVISNLRNANLYKQYEHELLRNAMTNRANLSLTGGSERSNYYLSGVYDYQTMNVGEKNNNLILNLKHNYKLTNKLSLLSSVNLLYNESENNGISSSYLINEVPFHNLLDENGKRIQYYMVDPWEGANREKLGYLSYTNNWLDEQAENNNTSVNFNTRIMGALEWSIIDCLKAETRFQYERGLTNNESLYSISHPTMRRLINEYTLIDGDKLNHQFPLGAQFNQSKQDIEAWTWRNQMSFNKNWNDNNQLTSILGFEMRKYKTTIRQVTQYGFDENNLTYIPLDESKWLSGKVKNWSGAAPLVINKLNDYHEVDNRDVSLYLNGAYTLMEKYSFNASGRIDQSNIFGNNSKYKYNIIWSSGLGWNISKEEFMKKDWIDYLTLRATYGIGGNVNKSFYPVLMGTNEVDSYNSYIVLTNPANKNLKWETTTTYNFGIDFGFLKGRIFGNLDCYFRDSNDLLGRVSLDPTNGFDSAVMNFASIKNKGVELSLNSIPFKGKELQWQIGMNISYNNNEVTKVQTDGSSEMDYINMAPSSGSGVAVKGKPLGRLYAYDYAGLDSNGEPLLWQDGKKVNYAEYSGDKEDLVYMGTTEAPWFGGANTSLQYRGFTFSVNATYKFGHKFRMPVSSVSNSTNGYSNIADRWMKAGDEKSTIVPALKNAIYKTAQAEIEKYYKYADDNIRNAANVRLNEISLSYDLPAKLISQIGISALQVQIQARNLAQWTANKEGIDPDAVNMLSNSLDFPQPKSFIFGLNAKF